MAVPEMMVQCDFAQRDNPNITTKAWIDTKYAKLGMVVSFREDKDTWWKVTFVGSSPLSAEVCRENSIDWKRTRVASDI